MAFAFPSSFALAIILSCAALLAPAILGSVDIICEDLPKDSCAFAISGSSKRCVLESYPSRNGMPTRYQCGTSKEVVVGTMRNHVESDQCIEACGVDRGSVGISSDSLLESRFVAKLCSPQCYRSCPNIVDLYFNLAAGEGVFLPDLCQAQRSGPRRAMVELMSAGAALGPAADVKANHLEASSAPAPSPTFAF